jgi:hypothetical protein
MDDFHRSFAGVCLAYCLSVGVFDCLHRAFNSSQGKKYGGAIPQKNPVMMAPPFDARQLCCGSGRGSAL